VLPALLGRLRRLFDPGSGESWEARLWPRPRIVWIGASVSRAWGLPWRFPEIRVRVVYDFDKAAAVASALRRRPDAIVLKECAAYFPTRGGTDPAAAADRVTSWAARVRAAGVRAVVATVAPVTAAHDAEHPGRSRDLLAFNDLVRARAAAGDFTLLDLEAALRVSDGDRHLDPALADPDGLHLAPRAYRERLDPLAAALVASLRGPGL
jgi:hypothetical protein